MWRRAAEKLDASGDNQGLVDLPVDVACDRVACADAEVSSKGTSLPGTSINDQQARL